MSHALVNTQEYDLHPYYNVSTCRFFKCSHLTNDDMEMWGNLNK